MKESKESLIWAMKDVGALEFGRFKLKSGRDSNYYVDLRKLTLSGHVGLVAGAVLDEIEHIYYDAVGGPELGAVPLTGAVLALSPRPLRGFAVRKRQKDHGKSGLVVGSVRPGDRCVVLEDVTTSGGSLADAVDAVEDFGGVVVYALTVLDRTGEAAKAMTARTIAFSSLLRAVDLGDVTDDLSG